MIRLNKSTGTLIIVMSVLALSAIVVSQWYYRNLNASVDPRIVPARDFYENYNRFTQSEQLDSVFILMDTIESIYNSVDHYRESFEVGVLYNNRAAAWLTIALFSELRDSMERDSLVFLAKDAVRKSISIYDNWKDRFENKNEEQVKETIVDEFMEGVEIYSEKERDNYLKTRTNEILDAQEEVNRRLSVSYTNLGIVYRHRLQYDSAALSYNHALELWDRNLTAENNLNILLGRPLKKRNIIQRIFPPDRL